MALGGVLDVKGVQGEMRDVADWQTYLVSPIPPHAAVHARVLFDIGPHTRRGRMATACSVVSPPVPLLERPCRTCGMVFGCDAMNVAWLKVKGLSVPANCESCRAQRRREQVSV